MTLVRYWLWLVLLSGTANCQLLAQPAKIIGLMAVRNEAPIVANALRALALYTDAIIVLDDASQDDTVAVLKSLQVECKISEIIEKTVWHRDEPGDKNRLLQAGRALGGTHFIMIDADEVFTANLLENGLLRQKILALQPGDKLSVTWINLWRSPDQYRYDSSVWSGGEVDAAFCDDGACFYDSEFIHTPRTPQNLKGQKYDLVVDDQDFTLLNQVLADPKVSLLNGNRRNKCRNNVQLQRCLYDFLVHRQRPLATAAAYCRSHFYELNGKSFVGCYRRDFTVGLMHFQFVNWQNLLIKQAWYRCLEKIRNPQVDVIKLNRVYGESKREKDLQCLPVRPEWYAGYANFFDKMVYLKVQSQYQPQVLNWFQQYGREFFRDLDIWDITWPAPA